MAAYNAKTIRSCSMILDNGSSKNLDVNEPIRVLDDSFDPAQIKHDGVEGSLFKINFERVPE